jgi:hypothetical protein
VEEYPNSSDKPWLQINQKSPHLQVNEGERISTPGGRYNALLAVLVLLVLIVPWIIGIVTLLRWVFKLL